MDPRVAEGHRNGRACASGLDVKVEVGLAAVATVTGSKGGYEVSNLFPGINEPNGLCCDCCERPVGQLKPFGGPGDPLTGDFSGAYLVKKWRSMTPYILDENGRGVPLVEEEAQIAPSWECRECACLSQNEYILISVHRRVLDWRPGPKDKGWFDEALESLRSDPEGRGLLSVVGLEG